MYIYICIYIYGRTGAAKLEWCRASTASNGRKTSPTRISATCFSLKIDESWWWTCSEEINR